MNLLKVIQMGHPTLKKVAAPVSIFDSKLKKFAQDMLDTMFVEEGIGLAAPQVNKSIRVIVIDLPLVDEDKWHEPMVFINPEIIESEGSYIFEEGCLSVPELKAEVERFKKVKVQFNDLKGKLHIWEAEDLLAVVFQHEIDHLNGILFVDRVTPETKLFMKQFYDKKNIKHTI